MRTPIIAIAAIFFSLPLLSITFVLGISVFKVVFLINMFICFVAMCAHRQSLYLPPRIATISVAMILAAVAPLVFGASTQGINNLLRLGTLLIMYVGIVIAIRSQTSSKLFDIIQVSYNVSIGIVAFSTVVLVLAGSIRPRPLGLDPNYAGYLIAIGILICQKRNALKWKLYRLSLIIPLIMTGSRTALLLLCVIIPLLIWNWKQFSKLFRKVVITIFVSTVAAAFLMGGPIFWLRNINIPVLQDLGARLELVRQPWEEIPRYRLWTVGFSTFLDNPLTGGGLGTLKSIYQNYGFTAVVAHNVVIEILAEMGLIGLIIFGMLINLSFPRPFRTRTQMIIAQILGITILNSIITGSIYDIGMWLVLALGAGFAGRKLIA